MGEFNNISVFLILIIVGLCYILSLILYRNNNDMNFEKLIPFLYLFGVIMVSIIFVGTTDIFHVSFLKLYPNALLVCGFCIILNMLAATIYFFIKTYKSK